MSGARRYRRLTKLQIEEVSSVTAGANSGARIVFTKRDDQAARDTMPTTSQMVAKASQMRHDGQITGYTEALLHQTFAKARFPGSRSTAEALCKWYDTAEGQEALHSAVSKNYQESQFKSGVGDGFDVVTKAGTSPKLHRARGDGGLSDDPDEQIDELAEQHRKANPKLTKEQSVAHVIQHTDEGRALFQQAKARHLQKNA